LPISGKIIRIFSSTNVVWLGNGFLVNVDWFTDNPKMILDVAVILCCVLVQEMILKIFTVILVS
jgi:hypothetical protein